MGREIRLVPRDWKHPENEKCNHIGLAHQSKKGEYAYQYNKCFRPLHDKTFAHAREEWLDGLALWLAGKHPDQEKGIWENTEWWEYAGNPPVSENYRPDFGDTATCYQLYETVSEGTPLSPVFETLQELEDYLVEPCGYSREAAHQFCKDKYAPSGVFFPGIGFISGIEAAKLSIKKEIEK